VRRRFPGVDVLIVPRRLDLGFFFGGIVAPIWVDAVISETDKYFSMKVGLVLVHRISLRRPGLFGSPLSLPFYIGIDKEKSCHPLPIYITIYFAM
jgi:hypothetical protein